METNFEFLTLSNEELANIDGGLTTGGLLWAMGVGGVGGAISMGPAGAVFGTCWGAVNYVISDYLG